MAIYFIISELSLSWLFLADISGCFTSSLKPQINTSSLCMFQKLDT